MSSQRQVQKKPGSNSYSPPAQKAATGQRPFSDPIYDAVSPKQEEAINPRAGFNLMQMRIFPDSPAPVQAKLTVGAPGDKYEQEADGMAAKVMAMRAPENEEPIQRQTPTEEKKAEEVQTKPDSAAITPLVQRETTPEEPQQEELVQAKALSTATIQRETTSEEPQEEEEPVQAKAESEGKSSHNGNLESQLNGSKGGGSPLPDEVRAFMEPRFGADFSGVRVHTDGAALQMNKELGAQAFAHGSDIYYGAGKSPGKDELTAHELTHVVQQTGGAKQIAQTKTEVIQRFAQAAPALAFGPVGLTVAFGIAGVTIVVLWLNNGGWEEIGRITDAIAKGIDRTLEELGEILDRAGQGAKAKLRQIEEYLRRIIPSSGENTEPLAAIQTEKLLGNTRQMAMHLARLLRLSEVGGMPPEEDPDPGNDNDKHWWKEIKAFIKNIQQAIKGASRKQIMRELRKKFTEEQIIDIERRLIEAAKKIGEEPPQFLPPG